MKFITFSHRNSLGIPQLIYDDRNTIRLMHLEITSAINPHQSSSSSQNYIVKNNNKHNEEYIYIYIYTIFMLKIKKLQNMQSLILQHTHNIYSYLPLKKITPHFQYGLSS